MRVLKWCSIGIMAFALSGADISSSVEDVEPEHGEIVGKIGLPGSVDRGCIAVVVPACDGMVIGGVRWYNNDSTVHFPEILVQAWVGAEPADIDGAIVVAENAYGSASEWSDIVFDRPVVCGGDGLYIIFEVAQGSAAVRDGDGGGAAIGYMKAPSGLSGWLSGDGSDWMAVDPAFGMAVEPIIVDPSAKGVINSAVGISEELDSEAIPQYTNGMESAVPNPFNAETTLRFSVEKLCQVDLDIFNIRGELVTRLVSAELDRGIHSVTWRGTDHRGLTVSSGTYLVRLKAGKYSKTQRIVVIK